MGGSGRKTVQGQALTERKTVRDVDGADANVDAVDEVINTLLDDNAKAVAYGYGATLALFLILDSATSINFELWYRGNDEEDDGASSSSSPSGDDGNWCRYATVDTITTNRLLVYADVPAGEWKVVIPANDGRVIIREAHST